MIVVLVEPQILDIKILCRNLFVWMGQEILVKHKRTVHVYSCPKYDIMKFRDCVSIVTQLTQLIVDIDKFMNCV